MSAVNRVGRPMRADAARNRAALLAAASAAFARQGVTASLDDVAREAGVGPGTLYRHFPTRDHLVLAVIEGGLLALRDLGVELLDEPDPVAALRHWLDAYIQQGSVYDGLARTLVGATSDDDASDACARSRAAGAALVTRAVDAGRLRGDTDFDDVLDMAAAIAWLGEGRDAPGAQRERLVRILVDGLRRSAVC